MGCLSVEIIWILESTDGAGESTFMKDAMIASGIKNYSVQDLTYKNRCSVEQYRQNIN